MACLAGCSRGHQSVVLGRFCHLLFQARLLAPDPATTAANMQAHQLLYRSGLAVHVVVTVTNVPLALIFYELFKVVNRRVALLAAFFILVGTAIEAAGLLNQFAPLILLGNQPDASAFSTAQLQALASLPGHLSPVDYTLYTVFFGLDILCLSYLLFRSRFVPRAIAVPAGRRRPRPPGLQLQRLPCAELGRASDTWIQLPAPLAEGALSLWLLMFGVNVEWWTKRASGETRMRFPQMKTLR